MKTDVVQLAASHYIRNKIRLAMAQHAEMPPGLFHEYDATVTTRWFEAIAGTDLSVPENFNKLSALVHQVYVESVRQFKEQEQDMDPKIFHGGLADFLGTFDVNEMLPRGQA